MKVIKRVPFQSVSIALILFIMAAIGLSGSVNVGAALASNSPSNLQSISPEAILPGDAIISAAVGNQENAQITVGGGGYLVVWEDSRTNYAGILEGFLPSGGQLGAQTMKDIYAARLDVNGQLIDANPIVISQASWSQSVPQVAWNGNNWLVVWESDRQANFSSTKDIMAARISPQGQVLDNPPILVDGNPTIDERWPTIASDGTNWLVLWMDQGAYFELDAARIGPNGAVLDPGGVPVFTPSFPDAPYNPSLAFADGEYLVVFSANNKIKGLRLSTTVQPIGSVFLINNYGNSPEVSGNGTDFFAAWRIGYDTIGARITHNAVVLDPAGINISGQSGGYPYPDVSWDGANWLVAWVPYSNEAKLGRISPNGQVLDPNGITIATAAYSNIALAGKPNGGAQVVWTDLVISGLGIYDISGASVSAEGIPGTPAPISKGAPRQIWPDLAANGNGFLAVFQSTISGETRIKGQRLNADGSPIDAEPFLIAGGSNFYGAPRVAWNGTLYLVVWEDSSVVQGFGRGATLGKRVAADGTVLDAAPVSIMPGNTPDVAALDGTFLVVDTFEPVNHQRYPRAVRVGGDGIVLGSPVNIGSIYAVAIRVEALGNRWLAIWQDHPTHDNPRSNITAAFVNPDGTGAGEFLVADPGLDPARSPDIAIGNNQALLSYYAGIGADVSQGDIYARRILPDGTLLDSNPGIQVTSAPNAQFFPSAAWTGSEFLVAYEDYRNVPYLDRPISDVYATRIDSNGAILDPNGFVIANSFIPEVNPIVASNPGLGTYLLGFANFKSDPPYSHYRIDIRHGTAGSPPIPEASATPTNTPIPTPPVCVPGNYVIAEATSIAIVPGTTDIGNHCDECATEITLPFPFTLYDSTFTTVEATANGTLNFVDSGRTGGINFCLPYSGLGYSILPHWDDLMTIDSGDGIFTSVSGSAPNRIFNIEWRACSWGGGGNCGSGSYNFEARLYEGVSKFEIIYGEITGNGSSTTVGVQKDTGQRYTQFVCNTDGLQSGLQLTFTLNNCGSPTPIPTVPTSTQVPPTSTSIPPSVTATTGATNTSLPTVTNTSVPGSTNTVTPAATNTPLPSATNTPLPGATNTTVISVTNTPGILPSATSTPPSVCVIEFSDVPPGSTFYEYVQCLACQGVLGGYSDGTFRPNNGVTRGQIAKIVANAAVWNEPVSGQTFADVTPDSTFYLYIERIASRGIVGGYEDGTFRPNQPATRGQIAKIVAKSHNYEDPMTSQTFEDVAPTSTFYIWIENLAVRGLMNGYLCGGVGEPCGGANKAYFRPDNNATRGQTAKIVSNTFFPDCQP